MSDKFPGEGENSVEGVGGPQLSIVRKKGTGTRAGRGQKKDWDEGGRHWSRG